MTSNSVFISYRRKVGRNLARSVYQDLTLKRHMDVFFDVETITAGRFDKIILKEIENCSYFLLILTPGTLARCTEPKDWLLREIEHALKSDQTIIPCYEPEFSFNEMELYLPSKIAEHLKNLQGIKLDHDYFEAAMERLCSRILQPLSNRNSNLQQTNNTLSETRLSQEEQLAESHLEQGHKAHRERLFDTAIIEFTKYILRNPKYVETYFYRGNSYLDKGDLDAAIADYTEAIRLKSRHQSAYFNRAIARSDKGDLDAAIADYTEAIRLKPKDAFAYHNRGNLRSDKGDLDGAVADYTEAIRLKPKEADTYLNRGVVHSDKGDLDGAIADYTEAIRLKPKEADAHRNRGEAYLEMGRNDEALKDFQKTLILDPKSNNTLPGLAITHHKLNNIEEAKRIWQTLLTSDVRYLDAEWVGNEFNWRPILVEEARKLIAKL
jgi:tetratricopeptide (TPR) repeat protein